MLESQKLAQESHQLQTNLGRRVQVTSSHDTIRIVFKRRILRKMMGFVEMMVLFFQEWKQFVLADRIMI